MNSIIQRFWGFDRLLGPVLVKFVYYVACAAIMAGVIALMLGALVPLFGGQVLRGLIALIAAPIVGLVALVYWRFICELFMIAFLTFERLGQVRDAILGHAPAPPDPNHPEF